MTNASNLDADEAEQLKPFRKYTDRNMFVGLEAEGPYARLLTLFVVGDVPAAAILDAVSIHRPAQIYFGADVLSAFSLDTVLEVHDAAPQCIVTVETPFPLFLVHEPEPLSDKYQRLYHMLPMMMRGVGLKGSKVTLDNYCRNNITDHVMVKLDTCNHIAVCTLASFIVNDNSAYQSDKVVSTAELALAKAIEAADAEPAEDDSRSVDLALFVTRSIWVTFDREGFHRYPDAPEPVAYLRDTHRHLFKFRVGISVKHNDRDIEFHMFRKWLLSLYCADTLHVDFKSCEMLAQDLLHAISAQYPNRDITVDVSEDGECGATLSYLAVFKEVE